ncbi:MAG: hypothetical protein F3743_07160 [Nitrospinae bacterium]|nr:hypothetical protein [Nitrospinota bacterium]
MGYTSAIQAAERKEQHHPWGGYEGGTGPSHWGEMEQGHEKHLMCREGVRQSPYRFQSCSRT